MSTQQEQIHLAEAFGLTSEGTGMARITTPGDPLAGRVVFCSGLMPGETANVILTTEKNAATLVRLITASPDRVAPFCPAYGKCGGCSCQEITQPALLREKERHIRDCLIRIGKQPAATIDSALQPIRAAGNPFSYRNHMQYPARFDEATQSLQLGLYAAKTRSLVTFDKCFIAHPVCEAIRRATEAFFKQGESLPVDPRSVRELIVRVGTRTGEVAAFIRSDVPGEPDYTQYRKNLEEALTAEKLPFIVLENHITETLGANTYRISPRSFFQVNTAQAEVLYDTVREFLLEDTPRPDLLLDMYCGTGSIGLHVARDVQILIGIESNVDAIADARENALINNIENATFHVSPAEDFDTSILLDKTPDAVIIDPPRKGCDKRLLAKLLTINPANIIYVSCDPATLSRDLAVLAAGGYEVKAIRPVDMFPWTGHVETVVLMSREESWRLT
jgi:23S rRNA (uracil1939-C5)-methyltransferase